MAQPPLLTRRGMLPRSGVRYSFTPLSTAATAEKTPIQILDWCRTVSLNALRRNRHVRKTFCVSDNDGPHRTGHNCERSERTRATGDLRKRCGAHSPAVLPNLPPSRFDCADVFTNV